MQEERLFLYHQPWHLCQFYDYIIAKSDEKLAKLNILGSKAKAERYRHLVRLIRQRAWIQKMQLVEHFFKPVSLIYDPLNSDSVSCQIQGILLLY